MTDKYLANVNFLIVDDNAFMRTILRRVLNALEVGKVRDASDGAEALKVMQTFQPDIGIVDWEMEPLDGLEFVKLIRTGSDSPNPYLPIIMLSGHSEIRRVVTAREAGVTEFVVKPISVKALFSRIQAIIERPRGFVRTKTFFGPDRRRKDQKFSGDDRRLDGEDGKQAPPPDREMEQTEVNAFFNPGSETDDPDGA